MKTLHTDVVVIGGGIAGLSAARAHQDKGRTVMVLEQERRAGGVLGSTVVDSVPRNHSAQTIAVTNDLEAQLAAWDLMQYLQEAPDQARSRCIVHNDTVHRFSHPGQAVTSGLIPLGSVMRVVGKMRRPMLEGDPTVAVVARHYADDVVLDRIIRPIITGIYAGNADTLSFSSCFPRITLPLQRARGSRRGGGRSRRIYTPIGGMQRFIDHLSAPLTDVSCSTPASAIEKVDDQWHVYTADHLAPVTTSRVVITSPAAATARIIEALDAPLSSALASIRHSGVYVLHCSYDGGVASPLQAFGALWADNGPVRGVIDLSTIMGVKGRRKYCAIYADVTAVQDDVLRTVSRVLNIKDLHIDLELRWEGAIPQYEVGHQEIMDRIASCEASHPGLSLIGSYRGGVSIADRILQGVRTA